MARLRDYEAMETEELLSIVADPRSAFAQRADALVALRRRGISQLQVQRMIANRQRDAAARSRRTAAFGEDAPEAVAQRDAAARSRRTAAFGEDAPEAVAQRDAAARSRRTAAFGEDAPEAVAQRDAMTLRNQEVAVGAEPGVDAPPRQPALPLPPTPPRQPPRRRREEVSADRLNEFSLALARGTPIDEAALTAAERKALETMRKRMGLAFARGGRIPAPVREGVPRRVGKLPTRIKLR